MYHVITFETLNKRNYVYQKGAYSDNMLEIEDVALMFKSQFELCVFTFDLVDSIRTLYCISIY